MSVAILLPCLGCTWNRLCTEWSCKCPWAQTELLTYSAVSAALSMLILQLHRKSGCIYWAEEMASSKQDTKDKRLPPWQKVALHKIHMSSMCSDALSESCQRLTTCSAIGMLPLFCCSQIFKPWGTAHACRSPCRTLPERGMAEIARQEVIKTTACQCSHMSEGPFDATFVTSLPWVDDMQLLSDLTVVYTTDHLPSEKPDMMLPHTESVPEGHTT